MSILCDVVLLHTTSIAIEEHLVHLLLILLLQLLLLICESGPEFLQLFLQLGILLLDLLALVVLPSSLNQSASAWTDSFSISTNFKASTPSTIAFYAAARSLSTCSSLMQSSSPSPTRWVMNTLKASATSNRSKSRARCRIRLRTPTTT